MSLTEATLESRIRELENENQQLRRLIKPRLPPELLTSVWEHASADQRILQVSEEANGEFDGNYEQKTVFWSARPPAILHVCQESRRIALRYLKPFFTNPLSTGAPVSRPIYISPQFDVLYLNLGLSAAKDFMNTFPEANKI
ncbi:hypothetical protein QBC37DRAFT_300865 [Rhypophila decipiens]|uniref:2EXR domain-containing protein n=1 Tax=Rhypophila decipiens TaxID=261697 RepID=A0AAN6XT21_9PEZI|nr:hypothetical protein QBC37DRAFT_300865 [Rhypophila decipiens]